MNPTIDLNADLGEGNGELDATIMPFLSSCNIACGGHAGDSKSMQYAIELALSHNVTIGAHPSFPDRENFGRQVIEIANDELANSIKQQIVVLKEIAAVKGAELSYVKPHGALYNLAAVNNGTAELIASTIKAIDPELKLMGLAGSGVEEAAKSAGLVFIPEAFADRKYEKDGTLRSRKHADAVLTDVDLVLNQVRDIVLNRSTNEIPIVADSICLHSDTPGAVNLAEKIYHYLVEQGITIRSV